MLRVARVLALGAEREEKVATGFQSGDFESRKYNGARRRGIRRAFEDNELTAAKLPGDHLGRFCDEAQVGLALGGQRRGDADNDRVGLAESGKVGRGLKPAAAHLADRGSRDVADVRFAAIEPLDFGGVDVEAENAKAGGDKGA